MHGCGAIIPFSASAAPSCCSGGKKGLKKFEVPDDEEREAALGSLTGTTFVLSRVLACLHASCEPIDVPSEEDWLSQHDETGQTFDAFRAVFKEHRHKLAPNDTRCTIHILPIGNFGHCPQLLTCLADLCSAFFAPLRCALLRMHLPPVDLLRDGALEADVSLKWMVRNVRKDSLCTIALTMVPLCKKGTPVFGLSDWDSKVGIFSLAAYAPQRISMEPASQPPALPQQSGEELAVSGPTEFSRNSSEQWVDPWRSEGDPGRTQGNMGHDDGLTSWQVLLERCCKLVTHEVVHLFGIMHCVYSRCLMNGSNNLTEMDAKPPYLCAMCLRKLHEAIPFAPLERYEKLAEFWKSAGFPTTAEWYLFRVLLVKQTFAATGAGAKLKPKSCNYIAQAYSPCHPCPGKFCPVCRDAEPRLPTQKALPDGVERHLKPVLEKTLENSIFDISSYEMMLATRKMEAVAKKVEERERAEPNKTLTKLRMRYPQYFGDLQVTELIGKGRDTAVETAPDSPAGKNSRKMKDIHGKVKKATEHVNAILRMQGALNSQDGSGDESGPTGTAMKVAQQVAKDSTAASSPKEATSHVNTKRASFAGVARRASLVKGVKGTLRRNTAGEHSASLAPIAAAAKKLDKQDGVQRGRAKSVSGNFSRISISEPVGENDDNGPVQLGGSRPQSKSTGVQEVSAILKGRSSVTVPRQAMNVYAVSGNDEPPPSPRPGSHQGSTSSPQSPQRASLKSGNRRSLLESPPEKKKCGLFRVDTSEHM